jgi:2-furoyl-CoA dehydrogenase large subunit
MAEKRGGDRKLRGEGEAVVTASAQQVWDMLLDPNTLAAVIPGCHGVEKISDTHFRADVTLGIGPVKGRYRAEVKLSDLDPPQAVTLAGHAEGGLGFGNGEGRITLRPGPNGGTAIHYVYEAGIGGKVASIGGRLLDGAAKVIIGQFFAALARKAGGGASASEGLSLIGRLRRWIGGPR